MPGNSQFPAAAVPRLFQKWVGKFSAEKLQRLSAIVRRALSSATSGTADCAAALLPEAAGALVAGVPSTRRGQGLHISGW